MEIGDPEPGRRALASYRDAGRAGVGAGSLATFDVDAWGEMIIDYMDGSTPVEIEADLCIIGAGAAGIAIARRFIGTAVTVCLLEGGGASGEESSQALYEGDTTGCPPLDPGTSRMRVFGGSCNLWGGGCIPLTSEDMAARDWVPDSGWPISYAELDPYYQQARAYCQLDAHAIKEGSFTTPLARAPLDFEANTLVNQVFARSPILFGKAYRAELEQAQNITLLLHANLLELKTLPNGTAVALARIGSLSGHRGVIRARHFVLACGGIENARQLLLSDADAPAGLGNRHDQVGRYFMDHPCGTMGTVMTESPDQLTRPYDRNLGKGPAPAFPEIAISHGYQRTHRLLSGRVHPFPVEGEVPKGLRALRNLRAALRAAPQDENHRLEERLQAALKNGPTALDDAPAADMGIAALAFHTLLGAGDIARALIYKLSGKSTVRSNQVALIGYFEQAPNAHSRITLGNEIDRLGLRKVCVDWQLTPLDLHTYRTAATLFGDALARACGGRFQLAPWLADADKSAAPQVHGTAHHLGTTRMSDDPTRGVVDRDCRVHGLHNLHIAGSSVFPTGGWAFPTLTLIALSLRLAEKLTQRLSAIDTSEAA